ncbi:PilZ domain-containing protein [Calidifontibacillus oryziterrae]|uniref:PilZ domain-containing protein n=1 Tax=Calidifontibacillus oryziterrae TaxID=1191699 RepID=UPI0002DCFA76|nr:PilZ domain-containing protein [Calidifontibacillus oryziterrae]
MNNNLDQQLLGEICTLKYGQEILVGQIVQIDEEHFTVKLVEGEKKSSFLEKQAFKITIETLDRKIRLLDAEFVSESSQDMNRLLLLKATSDIQFQSKRQGPRLPCTTPIDILYRVFPPIYHSWKTGSFFNISTGGAQFIGDMYIAIGELMEVKLGPPFFAENEIVISRIVHASSEKGKYTFSIQFLNLQETHKEQLNNYIKETLSALRK